MNAPVMPKAVPRVERLTPSAPARDSGWATLPADRSFKVLQPSRMPSQLSLFPPGLSTRNGR
ncbi:MAG TPA: hypothetical protein VFL64_08230 [Rhizobacter sp.]|nr:hypothetical protein [Rhizobacter sp.]